MLKFISPEQEGVFTRSTQSIPQVSMGSLRHYPRQHIKSDYRDTNTACFDGKQSPLVNVATLTMNVGIISVLMPWANIRRENGMCASGWNGIEQPRGRDLVAKFKTYTKYVTSYE
jgi:hypothetical protein